MYVENGEEGFVALEQGGLFWPMYPAPGGRWTAIRPSWFWGFQPQRRRDLFVYPTVELAAAGIQGTAPGKFAAPLPPDQATDAFVAEILRNIHGHVRREFNWAGKSAARLAAEREARLLDRLVQQLERHEPDMWEHLR